MRTILLIHGALGSKEDLQLLLTSLGSTFAVYSINLYGHNGEPVDQDFSIEGFGQQVLDWMREMNLETINIAGYSLGGYIALYLALSYPEKIEKIVTLGTKLYWDRSIAEKEAGKLDAQVIQERFPDYASQLITKHSAENWKTVLAKTAGLFLHIGQFNPMGFEKFSNISCPVLLILGDRDKSVSIVETTTAYKELPQGHLAVLPNTRHAINEADHELLAYLITSFINL
ncbi:MAG: alpha/beta hydrolase [Chitinophagaceae bacterium]|nr:alpha/beta hydrolase [Chitinophagaceae bacterium]